MSSDGQSDAQGGQRRSLYWLQPVLFLGFVAASIFFGFYFLDWLRWTPGGTSSKPPMLEQLFSYDPDTAQNALGNLAQVIGAVLGIVITVVSIVVQLAATRYTPRIAEMFFKDRTNLLVLSYFVVAVIDAVWVSLSVTKGFVPRATITSSLILTTTSVLMMMPYFAYVFAFLDPEKVVARIQEQAVASALGREQRDAGTTAVRQARVLQAIEQLCDVAMNAISQKDKLIAQGAVDALKAMASSYLPGKKGTDPSWFVIGNRLRQNPDFVSMSVESVDQLAQDRVWVEWKVLRQYQAVFNESLGEMPEMSQVVAIDTRYIGEAALATGDDLVVALVVKFFNTYLRATLNASQIRTAYNLLNQYRQFTERVIESGSHDKLAVEVAGYFRYYSQLALNKQLTFVTETVAYDLASLCEHAHATGARCHEGLLRVLLDLDREAETAEQEKILRGVRKAQAKLASFYLVAGAEVHARAICDDMRDEPANRLVSIRDELLGVSSKDFWEVIDRGTNFDYMDATRKQRLREFFSWFPSLQPVVSVTPAVTGVVSSS